jgi:hypothetical protein
MTAKLKFIVPCFIAILLAVTNAHASSIVVNVDATSNSYDANPVVLDLAAGTYIVQPIGPAQGGLYTAWDYYAANNIDDVWLDGYIVATPNPPNAPDVLIFAGFSDIYTTPDAALANAVTSTFTLTSPSEVDFGILDSNYADNQGGVSLLVSSTPEPESLTLLGTGLGVIGCLKARRKQIAS